MSSEKTVVTQINTFYKYWMFKIHLGQLVLTTGLCKIETSWCTTSLKKVVKKLVCRIMEN